MSMNVSKDDDGIQSEINVVPLCDVLLVLLIIFMVVTPLIKKGVDVRLPTALNMVDYPENPELVLSIRQDGSLYLNNQLVAEEDLSTLLEEALMTAGDTKLYLKADQDLEFGRFVEIIGPLKDAGVEIVGIIAEKKTDRD